MADVAPLEDAMRAARVHRHLTIAAGERELLSRILVEACKEALVDVDAVLVRRAEDDDREAVPPVVHGHPAFAVHPKVVSERLGHASIAITLDTYSNAVPAMQERRRR